MIFKKEKKLRLKNAEISGARLFYATFLYGEKTDFLMPRNAVLKKVFLWKKLILRQKGFVVYYFFLRLIRSGRICTGVRILVCSRFWCFGRITHPPRKSKW